MDKHNSLMGQVSTHLKEQSLRLEELSSQVGELTSRMEELASHIEEQPAPMDVSSPLRNGSSSTEEEQQSVLSVDLSSKTQPEVSKYMHTVVSGLVKLLYV